MEHEALSEAHEKMDKSLVAFQNEISHIRTGRASTGLVDSIEVEVYGQKMKINEIATTAVPEPRMITIQPWDKSNLATIEKAVSQSPLEVNPSNDGNVIRVPLPELSEERRKEYVKIIGKLAEDARVSVRNIRRHEVDVIKKQQKSGDIPEDDAHKLTDAIQKVTDDIVAKIDTKFEAKESEIMEV